MSKGLYTNQWQAHRCVHNPALQAWHQPPKHTCNLQPATANTEECNTSLSLASIHLRHVLDPPAGMCCNATPTETQQFNPVSSFSYQFNPVSSFSYQFNPVSSFSYRSSNVRLLGRQPGVSSLAMAKPVPWTLSAAAWSVLHLTSTQTCPEAPSQPTTWLLHYVPCPRLPQAAKAGSPNAEFPPPPSLPPPPHIRHTEKGGAELPPVPSISLLRKPQLRPSSGGGGRWWRPLATPSCCEAPARRPAPT
jgi:hypothetical protein